MSETLDETDRRLLRVLQEDAGLSMDALAERVHLSRNACWRRVKALEARGVVKGRVAIVDPEKVGSGLMVIVLIRTRAHSPGWLAQFQSVVRSLPEIMSAHRTSGDLDYVLRVRVADVRDYDRFYQRFIRLIEIDDISASFVMEDIKDTTAIPV